EGSRPARGRHAKPIPGEGCRHEISGERVLRCTRHRASQVRDVAARGDRECVSDRRHGRVWRLSPNVLRSKIELRRSWRRRARTKKERAARPSQASGRRLGLHREASYPRRHNSGARHSEKDLRRVFCRRPSENDRARADWKKNSTVKLCAVTQEPATPQTVMDRYETLRTAALGEGLPRTVPSKRHVGMGPDAGRPERAFASVVLILIAVD